MNFELVLSVLAVAIATSAVIITGKRYKDLMRMPKPLSAADIEANSDTIMRAAMALNEQTKVEVAKDLDHQMLLIHNRVMLSNNRSAHIEHYLGMRSNKFAQGERMWDFQQVAKDLNSQRPSRPLSIHNKNQRANRRKAA